VLVLIFRNYCAHKLREADYILDIGSTPTTAQDDLIGHLIQSDRAEVVRAGWGRDAGQRRTTLSVDDTVCRLLVHGPCDEWKHLAGVATEVTFTDTEVIQAVLDHLCTDHVKRCTPRTTLKFDKFIIIRTYSNSAAVCRQ